MKKILLLVIGIVVLSVVGIKASELISSNQVIYKDNETVDIVLDNLFDELKVGKEKVAAAITAKGVETTSDKTLEEMAGNIDALADFMYNKGKKENEPLIKELYAVNGYVGTANTAFSYVNNVITPIAPVSSYDGNNFSTTIGSYNSSTGAYKFSAIAKESGTYHYFYYTGNSYTLHQKSVQVEAGSAILSINVTKVYLIVIYC